MRETKPLELPVCLQDKKLPQKLHMNTGRREAVIAKVNKRKMMKRMGKTDGVPEEY